MTMLELDRCHWRVESKWHCSWFRSTWNGMTWWAVGRCI